MTMSAKEAEKLKADLTNDDWMVREAAVDRLGEINNSISIAPLIQALSDRDPDIGAKAAGLLKAITAQDFGQDSASWQAWWDNNKNTFEERSNLEKKSQLQENGGCLIIGDKEKHEISFGIVDTPVIVNAAMGSSKLVREPYLFIDNDEIKIKEATPTFMGARIDKKVSLLNDRITLSLAVGNKERHNVEITYMSPSLLGSSIEDYFFIRDNDVIVYGTEKVSEGVNSKGRRAISLGALVGLGYLDNWVWHNIGFSYLGTFILGGSIGPAIYLLAYALGVVPKGKAKR